MGVFGLQFAASFGESSFIPAGDDEITSFCGQRAGYGQTNSLARPGDEGDFATEILGTLLYARRQWRLIPSIVRSTRLYSAIRSSGAHCQTRIVQVMMSFITMACAYATGSEDRSAADLDRQEVRVR